MFDHVAKEVNEFRVNYLPWCFPLRTVQLSIRKNYKNYFNQENLYYAEALKAFNSSISIDDGLELKVKLSKTKFLPRKGYKTILEGLQQEGLKIF